MKLSSWANEIVDIKLALEKKYIDILKDSLRNKSEFIVTYKNYFKKVVKGVWRMPWLSEAMKDVLSCDKLRLVAQKLWPVDFRMGQPT